MKVRDIKFEHTEDFAKKCSKISDILTNKKQEAIKLESDLETMQGKVKCLKDFILLLEDAEVHNIVLRDDGSLTILQ